MISGVFPAFLDGPMWPPWGGWLTHYVGPLAYVSPIFRLQSNRVHVHVELSCINMFMVCLDPFHFTTTKMILRGIVQTLMETFTKSNRLKKCLRIVRRWMFLFTKVVTINHLTKLFYGRGQNCPPR